MGNLQRVFNPLYWVRLTLTWLRSLRNTERLVCSTGISDLEPPMIEKLIKQYAPSIEHLPSTLDAEAILWGLYHCEKYDEYNKDPRFEKSYAPAGYYFEHSEEVRNNWFIWGREAACSFSNFQILFATAKELGYAGPPAALDSDAVSLPFVCKYVHRRIIDKGATLPEQVADAYNSGSFQDAIVPADYIKKFIKYYERALRKKCKDITPKPAASSI